MTPSWSTSGRHGAVRAARSAPSSRRRPTPTRIWCSAGSFGIQSIPTLMILRDQVIIFSQPGALPGDALEDLIAQAVNLDMEEVHREVAAGQPEA